MVAVAAVTVRIGADTRVRQWFLALLVADATWAFASVGPLEAATPRVALAAEVTRLSASSVAALTWFCFALVYAGRAAWLTRPRLVALAAPFVGHVVAFATHPAHGLAVRELSVSVGAVTTVVAYEFGPTYLVGSVYALGLVFAGTVVVVGTVVTDGELYADQSLALLVGSAMPIAGAVLTVAGVASVGATNLTPATLTVTAVSYGYALFRADLLAAGPTFAAHGREVAVESLDEGFLIADGTGRVVDVNPAAGRLVAADDPVGESLADCLPVDPTIGRTVVTVGDRTLEAEVVPVAEGGGRVVTLRDVSERERRRERVEVLNRVLRHNLRNDLNVVRGYASRIAASGRHGDSRADGGSSDGASAGDASAADASPVDDESPAGDVDTTRAAERIVDRAEALLTVADHARTLEEVIDGGGRTREAVDLRQVVARAVTETVESDDRSVAVAVDLPDEPVSADEAVVSVVIEQLVDNAIRHNDAPEPSVWIRGERDADAVRLAVADDGPGIPEQERTAVTAGTESALEHGSRLGLWLVRWGVQALDGELSIRDREPTGSVVEIRLPVE